MMVKGKRILRRCALGAAVIAVIAAFGVGTWLSAGSYVHDSQVEALEKHQGLSHAEAERRIDEITPVTEVARHALFVR